MSSGIDRLDVISSADLAALQAQTPVDWVAFYLNSPCQRLTRWDADALRALAPNVSGFLPIYVGSQDATLGCATVLTASAGIKDGDDAVRVLAEVGTRALTGHPCVLDIEAVTYQNRPVQTLVYATAWAATLKDWGYWPVFYSTGECLARLADYWGTDAYYWLAAWVYPRYTAVADYSLRQRAAAVRAPEGHLIWQYAAEGANAELGTAVDWSVGDPPLLRPDDWGL